MRGFEKMWLLFLLGFIVVILAVREMNCQHKRDYPYLNRLQRIKKKWKG